MGDRDRLLLKEFARDVARESQGWSVTAIVAVVIAAIAVALALGLGIPALLAAQDNAPSNGLRPALATSDLVPSMGDIVCLSLPSSPMSAQYWNNAFFESDIAVNPFDPAAIVTVSSAFALEPPCTFDVGLQQTVCAFDAAPTTAHDFQYVTSDGYTGPFQTSNLPLSTDVWGTFGDNEVDVGPSPVAGHPGRFTYKNNQTRFYQTMIGNPAAAASLAIAYSDDNGNTWSPLAIVQTPSNNSEIGTYNSLDRETICVDTDPHSPYFGSVYVTCTGFSTADPAFYNLLFYSRNGGVTWGVTIITKCDGDCWYLSWSNPFVGCAATTGGKLNVIMTSDSTVQYTSSDNGGLTFGKLKSLVQWTNTEAVLSGTGPQALAYPGVAPRQMTGINAVIGSSHKNDLYVAFNQCLETISGGNVHCSIQLVQSHNGGRTWARSAVADVPGYSTGMPAVTTSNDGKRIVVLFYIFSPEFPLGTPTNIYNDVQATVSFVFSLDGGKTFTTPAPVSSVFDPNVAIRRRFNNFGFLGDYNNVVIDGEGNAHITWTDTSLGTPCQPYWDFANGITGTPFDLFTACPLNTTGRTDVFYRKVTFVPNQLGSTSPLSACRDCASGSRSDADAVLERSDRK